MHTSTLHSTGHPACLVLLATALLGGCSHTPAPSKAAWRIEPLLRTEHSPGARPHRDDAAQAAGHAARARQLDGEGRAREALDAWRQAVLLAPQDPSLLHQLGVALARQGRTGEALQVLRRANVLLPDHPPLLNNLGYVLLMDGQHEAARQMFDRVLQLAPDHAKARQNLARLTPMPVAPPVDPTPATAPAPTTASTTVPSRTDAQPQAPATTAPVRLAGLRTEVVNGNGRTGAAARMGRWLKSLGASGTRLSNRRPFDTAQTIVEYQPGQIESARALARQLAVPVRLSEMQDLEPRCDLRVVLGQDLRSDASRAPASTSPHARKGLAHMPAAHAAGG